MSDFVLEILDGDQAGTVFELRGDRAKLGRKPDNDLVLRDEKCSGHHAELVLEDGRHVLRDLKSTNGTMIDDRRITEIALTAGDIFQVGRVRIAFRRAGEALAAGAASDMELGTIDAARLRKSRRGGSALLTGFLLLLIAGGGAAYFLLGRGGGVGVAQGGHVAAPVAIPGNRLALEIASFEGDSGWQLQPQSDALGFEPAAGRGRVRSGSGALAAAGLAGDDDAGFALARLSEPQLVIAGQTMQLRAFVRTSGTAKVALRALLTSTAGELADLRTGSAPASASDWTDLEVAIRIPRGFDRLTFELLALVDGEDDEVLVDDAAILVAGDAPSIEGATGGATLLGSGATARIDGVQGPLLLGVEAFGVSGVFAKMAERGLLVMSDLGATLTTTADDRGFTFSYSGLPGPALRIVLPTESATPWVAGPDGRFRTESPNFSSAELRRVLVGNAGTRLLLEFESPIAVTGAPRSGAWSLEVMNATGFRADVVFAAETLAANEALREASAASDAGRKGEALAKIDESLSLSPHDPEAVRRAQELRSAILAAQDAAVEALLREGEDAVFFESAAGIRRFLAGVQKLEAEYGADRIRRGEAVRALMTRGRDVLAGVVARRGEAERDSLGSLTTAFEQAGESDLASFLKDYLERQARAVEERRDG
jgi:hypothetical protein